VSHGGEASAGPAATAQATAKPAAPVNLGFWDADEGSAGEIPADLDPAREFEAGRTALIAGAVDEAAFRFGLALRLAPALAPAVLEATEGARAANLTVVRGDAYRLAGHEPEARLAYAVAANGGLPERRAKVRPRPKVKPQVMYDDDVVEQPVLIDVAATDTDMMAPNADDIAEPATITSEDAAADIATAAEMDTDAAPADEAADEPSTAEPTASERSSDEPPG